VYPVVIIVKKEIPVNNKILVEVMEPVNDGVSLAFSKEIQQEELGKVKQNTWAHILGENAGEIVARIMSSSSLIGDIFDVSGAASVSEAYELKPLLKELSVQKEYFKFLNTGTIDRYCSLWKIYETRYIGRTFKSPIILVSDLKRFSLKRYEEAKDSKIVIAGMTKRLECFLDTVSYLAGKSTTIVRKKASLLESDNIDLRVLLATLNSKLMTFVYKNMFKSLSLAGGYMRVGPPQIRSLPMKPISSVDAAELTQLVMKMETQTDRLAQLGNRLTDSRGELEDQIKEIDAKIDELIFRIYGVTEEEKTLIAKNVPD
ncbi:MAG: TaqI-like C-terminal specificity domain-containing protein, partial [Nitrososphaera sp.]